MKPIRIFRHLDCEGPGYLLDVLRQHGFSHESINIDAGENVPVRTDDVSGIILMGGPMSVNDPLPWVAAEIALVQQAVKNAVPVLGICLGSQMIAKALGAKVYPGPCMEIGWIPIHITQGSRWTEDLTTHLDVFHWHGETFDLPARAEHLFRSDHFAQQGFAIGPHLALQFHVEVTAAMIEEWLTRHSGDLQRRCYHDHDASTIRQQTPQKIASLHRTAATLLGRWLEGCK
ncbi:MAG: gamma-glutamyl-gamma-aminobutyrate hydrolase family protein [Gammaproteobacteria bacterium]|nr:gamma-glutamyl-gamma-aminobutyrate hydrolase family protein [Gammaproteobacteria bacterium]